MDLISVAIVCPRCFKKAVFKTELIGTYKLYPNISGLMSCTHCGHNGEHTFSNQDYYYQIDVGGRKLFARNLENLIALRNFFDDGFKTKLREELEFDFPKEFYQNRHLIIKRISKLIEDERGYQ